MRRVVITVLVVAAGSTAGLLGMRQRPATEAVTTAGREGAVALCDDSQTASLDTYVGTIQGSLHDRWALIRDPAFRARPDIDQLWQSQLTGYPPGPIAEYLKERSAWAVSLASAEVLNAGDNPYEPAENVAIVDDVVVIGITGAAGKDALVVAMVPTPDHYSARVAGALDETTGVITWLGACSDRVDSGVTDAGVRSVADLEAALASEATPAEPLSWSDTDPSRRSFISDQVPEDVRKQLLTFAVDIDLTSDWLTDTRTLCFRTETAWSTCVGLAIPGVEEGKPDQSDNVIHTELVVLPGQTVEIVLNDGSAPFVSDGQVVLGSIRGIDLAAKDRVVIRSTGAMPELGTHVAEPVLAYYIE